MSKLSSALWVAAAYLSSLACSSPATDAPATGAGNTAGGSSGAGGNPPAPGAGSGGAGGGVGGSAPVATGGSGGESGGQASGGSGGEPGGAGQAGQAGGGGQAAQLPPGVPDGYTLQLDLPFSAQSSLTSILAGNQAGWTFDAQNGGALVFNGSGYTAPSPVNESLSSFAIVPSTKFGSFVLEVELAQTNPDQSQPHRDLCIVFNAQDEKHFLYAHIAQTHDERSHNIHLIDNAPRQPITVTHNGGIQWGTAGTWHKFRLTRDAASGAVAVYMNDQLEAPILTANSTVFTSGYIGFGTFMDGGRLRNLKVWAAAAEQVATTDFFDQ